ncbi:peroxidase 2 [Citrus sinensis]|nr:peroxidase 2 [Citrus sinensis]
MATSYYLVLLLLIAASASLPANCNLSKHHYRSSCPEALSIVQAGVKAAVKNETRTAASLLRLHFYDCFVNACNFKSLHTCSHLFVFALDILAIATRDSVVDVSAKYSLDEKLVVSPSYASISWQLQLGGPSWKVRLERRDSTTVSRTAANTSIRRPTSNLSALISNFMGSLIEAHGSSCWGTHDRPGKMHNISRTHLQWLEYWHLLHRIIAANMPSKRKWQCSSKHLPSTCFDNLYYKNLLNEKSPSFRTFPEPRSRWATSVLLPEVLDRSGSIAERSIEK